MIDRGEVARRIQTIQHHVRKLIELQKLTTNEFSADEHLSASAERSLQICCEACIEIGLLCIAGLNLKRPSSYEEIAELLQGAGFTTSDYVPQIERIVKVRNALIHSYGSIEASALHNQLGPRVMDLEFFTGQAVNFVRRLT